jgi:hypothetical protein
MSEDDSGLGLKVHEDAYRELERERDEWKAKYINQNKDLGCEMMDPAGTIWDYTSGLQRENVQLKREVEGWMAEAKQWRENAIKLHEQRDRVAEEIENLKVSGIHTCHDQCKRPMCAMRRQRDMLTEALKDVMKYRKGEEPYDYWRLPESHRRNVQFDGWNEIENRINEALAAVKGGGDERR